MSEPEQRSMPTLGAEGARCAKCGSPLATDQRYCLECGARRGDARLPYERYLAPPGPATNGTEAVPAAAPPPAVSNEVSPLGAILGVALLGGMLLIGVLLGRGEDEAATTPQTVVQTTGSGTETGPSATDAPDDVAPAPVTSEWPAGKDGFTIELGTLPKDGTTSADVDAAKADLESQGATDLGVLDSDLYPSLPGGNFVIYSGVHETKDEAKAALEGLQASFPTAGVIEVSQQATTSGGTGSGGGGSDDVEEPAAQTPEAPAAEPNDEALQPPSESEAGVEPEVSR